MAGLRRASEVSGTEPALLLGIAAMESSLDPDARSTRSSARGLMQFTRQTWLEAVRDHGARHGLAHLSRRLETAPNGQVSARDPRVVERVLKLRDDPGISAALAAERLAAARALLEEALDRPAAPADVYLVHLMGRTGALRFLREHARAPGKAVTEVVGLGPVAANAPLFFDGEKPLTIAASYGRIRDRLAASLAAHATLLPKLGAQPLQVAEAR